MPRKVDRRQSDLIKAGLERAKSEGVKLGAPSKLTPEAAVRALDLHKQGNSMREIGRILGVSAETAKKSLIDPEGKDFFRKEMVFRKGETPYIYYLLFEGSTNWIQD